MTARPDVSRPGTRVPARPVRLLVIDPLAGDSGHLLDDDAFWAAQLPAGVAAFGLRSSGASVAHIREALGPERAAAIDLRSLPRLALLRRAVRLRLALIAATLRTGGYHDILFQSFEEISTLVFVLLRPAPAVHLVVTNNLSPDRFERHGRVVRWLLRAVFRRAATVFVHCEHEVGLLVNDLGLDRSRICVKPFHQLSAPWPRPPFAERAGHVLFMGPAMENKPLRPVLELIRADAGRRFSYVLAAMNPLDPATRDFLAAQPNVRVRNGYLPTAEYRTLLMQAGLVLCTHDARYQGRLSGVFCDAIAAGTPVVTGPIAPFTEFFDRYGPLGLLVDYRTPDWWRPVLELSLRDRFAGFQEAAAACRADAAPAAVARFVLDAIARPGQTP